MEKHGSFNSCSKKNDLFRLMFPDSVIASKFSCGNDKAVYLTTFGIAPHFSSLLLAKVKSATDYILLFDESLNRPLQAKQLDVHVRFWDGDFVMSRYLDSHFLGHAYASDLHKQLRASCNSVGIHSLLQISMDGPIVNWKLFDTLSRHLEMEIGSKLLNIGSCGLHIMHNAFQAGSNATTWDIEHTLNSLYWLFKDSPARRDDYTSITDSDIFPLKYCKHRWLENVPVLERAISIWP